MSQTTVALTTQIGDALGNRISLIESGRIIPHPDELAALCRIFPALATVSPDAPQPERPQPVPQPDYLTVHEYATELRVSPRSVYTAVARGELESIRFGRTIRLRRGQVPTRRSVGVT
jgi:excisionase family DNA binding protein